MTETVNDRYLMALWYAFGRIDAGEGAGLLVLATDGPAFADEHAALTRDFLTEKTTYLPNIMDCWNEYVERKRAEAPPRCAHAIDLYDPRCATPGCPNYAGRFGVAA